MRSAKRGRTMTAEKIATALGLDLVGVRGVLVTSADPVDDAYSGSVTWAQALTPESREVLDRLSGALIVLPKPSNPDEQKFLDSLASGNALLVVEEPRLVLARILARFFSHLELHLDRGIDPSARVDRSAQIGADVTIGPFCFIGKDVIIGDGTILHTGVAVHSRTIVGRNCVLKSNAVVGSRGFGFVQTSDGSFEHFPQIGQVIIEDDVEIGACTAIDRPGLGTTRILRGTKIDNLCHVGHNAEIGPNAIVTACTEIGAGVVVRDGAWLGPNSCSIEGVTIDTRSFVGIGSTVLADVAAGAVVAGSPAEPIETVRKTRQALKKLVASGE
jgi:UDP-3-O-[3-hydroxymyristoyl] glucosamine N-acyltransferase